MSDPKGLDPTYANILANDHSCNDLDKRLKETCAALTLIQHTFQADSGGDLNTLKKQIPEIAEGIRDALDRN